MTSEIKINVPFVRYGNIVINKMYVVFADTRSGVVKTEDGSRWEFPPEIVGEMFGDFHDFKKENGEDVKRLMSQN